MNKKLKYLSIIPLYGTCILFVYLFVLSLKDKRNSYKWHVEKVEVLNEL